MKPERIEIYRQGLIAGLLGYAAVCIVFAIANVIWGRSPFYTAALLGGSVFYGVRDPADVVVWPGAVFAYNGVHLIALLVLGTIAAWLASFAERGPHFWYIGAVLFLFIGFHLFGVVFLLPDRVRAEMLGWTTLVAGMASMLAMACYLVLVHPRLRAEIRNFAEQDRDLADTVN